MPVDSVSSPSPQAYVPVKAKPEAAPAARPDRGQPTPQAAPAAAVLQEARETTAQTSHEARQGDHQAQRALQKSATHVHTTEATKVTGTTGTIINIKA